MSVRHDGMDAVMPACPGGAVPSGPEPHLMRILQVLGQSGALSRAEIAQRVGVSRTTLSELVATLLNERAIVVAGTDATARCGRGRPAERLVLDPAAGQFLGVDFGQRRVYVVVADASRNIIASGGDSCQPGTEWDRRIAATLELIDRLSANTGVHYRALRKVGIGFPGPLSPHVACASGGSRQCKESAVATVSEAFAQRFGTDVIVDNDVRFAALGEATWGRRDHAQDLLYVRVSDWIGGGMVVGGRLVAGADGFAGELGHVPVAGSGMQCRCGKRGCLETVASSVAILDRCRAAGVDLQSIEELRVAAVSGDPIVDRVVQHAGAVLGRIIGAAAVVLNPSEVVLAGEVPEAVPQILAQVRRGVRYELLPFSEDTPSIRGARLTDDAGAIGALSAIFHRSPLLVDYPRLAGTGPAVEPQTHRGRN